MQRKNGVNLSNKSYAQDLMQHMTGINTTADPSKGAYKMNALFL